MPIMQIAKQRLVRLLYPWGEVRRVLRGPLRGAKYVVEPSMGLTYALGFDAMNWEFLSQRIKPGMTIYDIGANRGQMAMFFSKIVGREGAVYSFEPVPRLCDLLIRNIALNNMGNVHPHCLALSDSDGQSQFLFSEDFATEGRLGTVEDVCDDDDFIRLNVTIAKLDTMIEQGLPVADVLKIDVEGAARNVLHGARGMLANHSPAIYIELHGSDEQVGVKEELQEKGYVLRELNGNLVDDPTVGWHSPLWCTREPSK